MGKPKIIEELDKLTLQLDDLIHKSSVNIITSETEPETPNKNMYWYKIGSFSGGSGGGDGVNIANASTGDSPPTQNMYWFDPV